MMSDRKGFGRALGNGHGVIENDSIYGRPIAMWHPYFGEEARPEIQSIKDDLISVAPKPCECARRAATC